MRIRTPGATIASIPTERVRMSQKNKDENANHKTPLSHRLKQGANFAWGQQSGAWGRAGSANLLGVKAALFGVCLGYGFLRFRWRLSSLGNGLFRLHKILSCVALTYPN